MSPKAILALVPVYVAMLATIIMTATWEDSDNLPRNYNVQGWQAIEADNDPEYVAWCDSIYHQNVGCPKYGQVDIPQDVLDKEEADHLAWCDSIYHQNVGCPRHGEVDIPLGVLISQEIEHILWCKRINGMNVGCPTFTRYDG